MTLFQANVIGNDIIPHEKPVGSPPYVLGDGLLAMYGDREGVTIHLEAADAEDAEQRVIARLGADVTIDELVEAVPIPKCADCGRVLSEEDLASTDPKRCDSCEQQAHFDLVSADIVAPLATGEAIFVADSLETLAGIDEGEHTNTVELYRVAKKFRDLVTEAEA